ncbi:hypothetical protein OIU77_006762 [Salix suchowensis]|uniref:FAS1 domain-containing protein n=1 Tax=Salix suchowensis TaxID=1278906 RepID=A0ABQ9ALS1_9ROSI|nr:hypothetical protein OIU77_006762 [Salix suchowensis]
MRPQDLMINNATSKILLHLLLLSLLHQITTAALTDQQLEFALLSLRSHGYTLFPNAISTSDLRFHLLNQTSNATSTFTLFSPPDSLLFSVDLSSTASHYTKSLFLHVSPSRLSMSDFRNLTAASGGTYIDSLVPNHRLLINNSLARLNGTVDGSVLVNRVRVSVPDLFLGPDIAVHGLDGILVAGFDDKVEDTSFEAATSSPANEIWSAELNSPPAVRFPARKRNGKKRRRNGKNRRRNGRNGGITRSNHRGPRIHDGFGRGGGRNIGGGTRGDGTHGTFSKYNNRL